MDSSNAEKAARAAYIAFHEGLSGFDAARAWDDMTSPADDWSQEAIDWTHAIKAALSSRDTEVAELREQLAAAEAALAKGREWLDADVLHSHDQWADLFTAPSVVLEDLDREVRAKEREKIAADIDDGVVEWDDLRPSDDGFRWAEQCVATAWDSSGVWTSWLRRTAAAIRKGDNA